VVAFLSWMGFECKLVDFLLEKFGSFSMSVLNDALTRLGGFKIPEGKYYLGDAGYGN
jgi:hypothetical protein